MASILKTLGRLFGGGGGNREAVEAASVEYNGYRIRPAPFSRSGQYQTAGIIEKEVGGEVKEHRFIRAESHPTREAAVEFSIAKAKQIIDEQGDRLFRAKQ